MRLGKSPLEILNVVTPFAFKTRSWNEDVDTLWGNDVQRPVDRCEDNGHAQPPGVREWMRPNPCQ